MTTQIYGASDDLIEFEGDVFGESGFIGERDSSALVITSDGTVLEVKYGKAGKGIWSIVLLHKGPLFDRIEVETNEDASRHSDTAHFKNGLTDAWVAKGQWELVQ